ncbi:MAG: NAD-dependent epimerase/dehydratase family protein [Bacteroidales bacterium]|nr:NAD-dependent epimerase/dehydratase family protein [Bacteroidales bacterium]
MITENKHWKPEKKSTFYSVSKFRAEMEVMRGIVEGLNAIIVNPSVVLGPGFWDKRVGALLRKIQNGFSYYTEGSTGYVDVRDVAHVMIQLMESEISGEQFIISSENMTFKKMIELFSNELKIKQQTSTGIKNNG